MIDHSLGPPRLRSYCLPTRGKRRKKAEVRTPCYITSHFYCNIRVTQQRFVRISGAPPITQREKRGGAKSHLQFGGKTNVFEINLWRSKLHIEDLLSTVVIVKSGSFCKEG